MTDPLSYESLFAGARKFAISAWHSHNRHSRDLELFVLHAGVSIERLAKAALVKKNRVLLMETNAKEEMLLHFAGVAPASNVRVRTISASGAIGRLRKLGVLRPKDSDLDGLIELRNGVAHLHADSEPEFDPVLTFARTTQELLDHLGELPSEYWGRMYSLANIALSTAQTEVGRSVALRVRAAKARFEERFHGLQGDTLKNYRETAQPPKRRFHRDAEGLHVSKSVECPACLCPAQVLTTMLVTSPSDTEVRFEAHTFVCEHCELLLEGREEFRAAKVENMISMRAEHAEARGRFMMTDSELGLTPLEVGALATMLDAQLEP
jgi:hypothetical protein